MTKLFLKEELTSEENSNATALLCIALPASLKNLKSRVKSQPVLPLNFSFQVMMNEMSQIIDS